MSFDDQPILTAGASVRAAFLCGATRSMAPASDYDVTQPDDARFHFRSRICDAAFTLSLDEVARHVIEGRLRVERMLPAVQSAAANRSGGIAPSIARSRRLVSSPPGPE